MTSSFYNRIKLTPSTGLPRRRAQRRLPQRTRDGQFRDFYTGVEAVADGRYDLLLVTLEKSPAQKEHLRYRDFPLSARRFHRQSKAGTTRTSRQGRRHLDPESERCTPLLFVRERADDRPGVTMAFRYLGPVRPASAEGERPITVEWELADPMPAESRGRAGSRRDEPSRRAAERDHPVAIARASMVLPRSFPSIAAT